MDRNDLVKVATGLGVAVAVVGLFAYGRARKARSWGKYTITKSLKGKRYLITGANTGLGLAAATQLAKSQAGLILACRNIDAAKTAAAEITAATGNADLECVKLDLSDLQSVRDLAVNLKSSGAKIDVLVCNAGVWVPEENNPSKTKDGFEIHAGVNHLGHFLLANLLSTDGVVSKDGRIVVVSSLLMNSGVIEADIENQLKNGRPKKLMKDEKAAEKGAPPPTWVPNGYADTKLMNGLFTAEFARRNPEGPEIFAVCPGWCYSDLGRNVKMPWYKKMIIVPLMTPIMALFMRTGAQGAMNIVHASVEESEKMKNGGFYRDCSLAEKELGKIDGLKIQAGDLWTISERLTGQS